MKRLHGEATATVGATAEECLSVLAAVARYPGWYPDVVRAAEMVAAGQDGAPTRAHVTLHVSRGPLVKDFNLLMEVRVARPMEVTLVRIPNDSSDEEQFEVSWVIDEQGDDRRIRLAVDAYLAVPRFTPLGGIGDDLAAGFVTAAARVLQPAS
jgi:hypothetical protein